jgi:uncharacterized membrane protein HdeD (DUF308 family)
MWFGSSRTLILRGLVTIAFGLLLMALPALSLSVLILLFGAFALVDGVLILTMGLQMGSGEPLRPIASVAGAFAIVVGIVTFFWPGPTELVLLILVAVRAMMVGIAEMTTASRLDPHSSVAWLLAGLGLVSIAFGALLLVYPSAGILALVWVIGLYAVVIGCGAIAVVWLLAMRYA